MFSTRKKEKLPSPSTSNTAQNFSLNSFFGFHFFCFDFPTFSSILLFFKLRPPHLRRFTCFIVFIITLLIVPQSIGSSKAFVFTLIPPAIRRKARKIVLSCKRVFFYVELLLSAYFFLLYIKPCPPNDECLQCGSGALLRMCVCIFSLALLRREQMQTLLHQTHIRFSVRTPPFSYCRSSAIPTEVIRRTAYNM